MSSAPLKYGTEMFAFRFRDAQMMLGAIRRVPHMIGIGIAWVLTVYETPV
jgi:hypothetical protein